MRLSLNFLLAATTVLMQFSLIAGEKKNLQLGNAKEIDQEYSLEENTERELQGPIRGAVTGAKNIISGAKNTISGITDGVNNACTSVLQSISVVPGISCECDIPSLTDATIGISCGAAETRCLGGSFLCGNPSWYGSFTASGMSLYTELCYDNLMVAGRPLAPLCVDYSVDTLSLIQQLSGLISNANTARKALNSVAEEGATDCRATFGETRCRSCNLCGDKRSITFDCSNIVDGFFSKSCAAFDLITNLRDMPQGKLTGNFPPIDDINE